MVEASLEMLQAMVQRVLDGQRLADDDIREVKERLTAVELELAAVRWEIERRLDQVEAPVP